MGGLVLIVTGCMSKQTSRCFTCRLKRAGLDYWPFVVVKVHENWAAFHDFFREQGRGRMIAFSKFGKQSHTAPDTYQPGAALCS
jgi:tRNA(Leu) C34 or U34 (ribose-2'-O)-methylase TrmL